MNRRRRTGGAIGTTEGAVMRRARAAALAAALVFLFVVLYGAPLAAHDPGLSSLDVQLGDARVVGTLSLSRADASAASAAGSIEVFALRSIILEVDGVRLAGRIDSQATESDAGSRLAIAFDRAAGSRLRIRSTSSSSLARGHRQLLTVRDADNRLLLQRMLDGSVEHVDLDVAAVAQRPTTVAGFVWLGVGHILSGVDHLAFLGALLLGVSRLRAVVTTVTAFTVAHSLTLSAAVLGLIDVPPAIVEPLIAASVVFVGLENLVRKEIDSRWKLTFAFGLVHGFGFAGALRELGIGAPGTSLAAPLGLFNAGVEIGQVAVAALLWPAIQLLKSRAVFHHRLVPACSLLVAAAGCYWMVERLLLVP
jgi:hydrogenase/urease accessory protein HupE